MLAPIIVGFAMATLGVALIFLGEVPFLSGKRIPARRARGIGSALVSFLPLAAGLTQLLMLLFGRESIDGLIVTWSMFAVCWITVIVILYPVIMAKKPPRPPGVDAVAVEPVFEVEAVPVELQVESEPAKKQPAKKSAQVKKAPAPKASKPVVDESNPFDFT